MKSKEWFDKILKEDFASITDAKSIHSIISVVERDFLQFLLSYGIVLYGIETIKTEKLHTPLTKEQYFTMKSYLSFKEQLENQILESKELTEVFQPKYPQNLKFNKEHDLVYTTFPYAGTEVDVSFDHFGANVYEVGFTTKSVAGFSLRLQNISNNSLGIFNFIIGVILRFIQSHKVEKLIISKPSDIDGAKRFSVYYAMLKRKEIIAILNSHHLKIEYPNNATIELIHV